ncbi:bacteriocin-like protein [Chryseobacterium sp. T16E-39]|uniref:bacteriocin-like protein n=1 Tax=Chryseobacterium sp. T16E-39 TaxID=2015076 RepID=UPI0026B50DE6
MKNLKKLNRVNLKSIDGGGTLLDECQVDLDCGPTGCAWCTDLRGRKVCLYSTTNPLGCPDVN